MEELIKRVSEKTGLSEDMARTAVGVVLGFLKERLPAPLASQLEGAIAGGGNAGILGNIADKVGGMFDK